MQAEGVLHSAGVKCYTKTGHKGVEKQEGKVYNKRSHQI